MREKLLLAIMVVLTSVTGISSSNHIHPAFPPSKIAGVEDGLNISGGNLGGFSPSGEGEAQQPSEGDHSGASVSGNGGILSKPEGENTEAESSPENKETESASESVDSGDGMSEGQSEAVDVSWFDQAVFVGDSVSLRLKMYCSSTNALGGAQFLCSGSLSAHNALWEISEESVHPSYQGTKMTVEDGIAQCGAKNVFIMLGMNDVALGLEESAADMEILVGKIREKSPDVNIVIQSVTPMMPTSTIWSDNLNNDRINQYNGMLLELCEKNGWYYLPVNEIFKDGDGNLKAEYCSDNPGMAIHFTPEACKIWVEYLFTHVPDEIK